MFLLRHQDQTERRLLPHLRLALSAAAVLALAVAFAASAAGWSELALRLGVMFLLSLVAFAVPRLLLLAPLFVLGLAAGAAGPYLLTNGKDGLAAAVLNLGGLLVFGMVAVLLARASAALQAGRGTHFPDGIDPQTGAFEERLLRGALEAELARARRFRRCFALVLVSARPRDPDARRREAQTWQLSYVATAQLLLRTRLLVDRVFLYGPSGFAMILPESGPREVAGLIRRLRRLGSLVQPPEGQPGGPFPIVFGATFYPDAATTVDALLTRASMALKLASKSGARYHLDGAEVPEPPPPESLRAPEETLPAAAREDQPEPDTGPVPGEGDISSSRGEGEAASEDVWLRAYASVFGEARASAGRGLEQLGQATGATAPEEDSWEGLQAVETDSGEVAVPPEEGAEYGHASTGDEDAGDQVATAEEHGPPVPTLARDERPAHGAYSPGLDADALRSGLAELIRDLDRATVLIRALRDAREKPESRLKGSSVANGEPRESLID